MMRRKEQNMGLLVRQFLREQGLETPLNEYRAVQAWPEVVGASIARYTGNISIRNNILYVQIRSAALRENLSFCRTLLARQVNEAVGAQVIREIHFY